MINQNFLNFTLILSGIIVNLISMALFNKEKVFVTGIKI